MIRNSQAGMIRRPYAIRNSQAGIMRHMLYAHHSQALCGTHYVCDAHYIRRHVMWAGITQESYGFGGKKYPLWPGILGLIYEINTPYVDYFPAARRAPAK